MTLVGSHPGSREQQPVPSVLAILLTQFTACVFNAVAATWLQIRVAPKIQSDSLQTPANQTHNDPTQPLTPAIEAKKILSVDDRVRSCAQNDLAQPFP